MVTIGHHAACCLGFNTEHPQLLVSGGRNCNDKSLRDVWKFDLTLNRWEHVSHTHAACLCYNSIISILNIARTAGAHSVAKMGAFSYNSGPFRWDRGSFTLWRIFS